MNWRLINYLWRLLPGSITALSFAFLIHLGAWQPLEQAANTMLYHLRGELHWDERLVLVTIDNASIRQLGRFPWQRQQYVKLLQTLNASEPSVIGIDLLWSEASPSDPALAQAMEQTGRVVLAEVPDQMGFPLPPIPVLQAAAIGTGHILNRSDTDGVTRKIWLQLGNTPAFSLAIVTAYALVKAPVAVPDLQQPFGLNWPGPVRQIPQYSFIDVVQGKVSAQAFRDKIVLVGVTATGIDELVTPFDRSPPASGLHLHAAAVDNLLKGIQLRPVLQDGLLLVLLGGPGISFVLSRRREEVQILIGFGACLGWGVLSFVLFKLGYWVPVVLPIALLTSTTIGMMVVERLRINSLLEHQVQQLWQRYEPDLVIQWQDGRPQHANHLPISTRPSVNHLAALADRFGRSQSTQAAIARSLSIGLLAADLDGLVWFCNPVAANWLHVRVGQHLTSGLVPDWLSQSQWYTAIETLQRQQLVVPYELYRDDRWFEMKFEALTYQPPSRSQPVALDGVLIVLEDITVRKQAEAALAQQIEELQRLSQLKDDFLSTVSHELRAPLTNIRLAIDLLSGCNPSEEMACYLKILENECVRETELINDLLDLQRLEAGAPQHQAVPIQLERWLPTIVKPFARQIQAHQQTLQLQLPTLPPVVTDQASLERIVVELINNACKYTPPEGTITIAAQANGQSVELSVFNTGVEIPAAELERIFQKFYRVPQADRWRRGGTGLGLALVKQLAESLGGSIQVKSGDGQTCFTIQLPLKYPDLPSA